MVDFVAMYWPLTFVLLLFPPLTSSPTTESRHDATVQEIIRHDFYQVAQGSPSTNEPNGPAQRAREFLKKGLLNDAEQSAREFLVQHPESADGHFLLGYILFKEHKSEASLAEYTEGARYHDPGPSDLKIVALNYVLLEDYADADKWLTRSVAEDPQDVEGWYYLGRTKYNLNRFEEAVSAFQECLKRDPKNIKAQTNLGLSLVGLGRIGEAQSAYRRAISQQQQDVQKNPEPFIDFGDLLLDENQPEDAIVYLSKAREMAPQEFRVYQSLGKAYLRLNRLPEAQTELEKAVSLTPDSGPAHYMLGQVYQKKGLAAQAKSEFDRAIALNAAKNGIPKNNR